MDGFKLKSHCINCMDVLFGCNGVNKLLDCMDLPNWEW